jgi:hypothetical protein
MARASLEPLSPWIDNCDYTLMHLDTGYYTLLDSLALTGATELEHATMASSCAPPEHRD